MNIFDFLEDLFLLAIEPPLIVHPLTDEFQGRLGTEDVLLWHVQIIDVNNHTLAVWHHLGLGTSNKFTFDRLLGFLGAGLTAEDQIGAFPDCFVQL